MAGVGIEFRMKDASQKLAGMIQRIKNPAKAMKAIGEHGVSVAQRRFKQQGPGWRPKHPYFAELQRRTPGHSGGKKALFAKGDLVASIVSELYGFDAVRVGSPLRKAATLNFGTPPGEPRSFYLYVIPDMTASKKVHTFKGRTVHEICYERNDYGFVLGRIGDKKDWQQKRAVRQLITVNIAKREFIKLPDDREKRQIVRIIGRYLAGEEAQA